MPAFAACIPLCLASLAHAAVDGTVTNRTTGEPQPGATVTLYKITQNGPEAVESVKSDTSGKFRIDQNVQGPRLLRTAYDGVTYNNMLPPGAPATGVAVDVYNSTKQPGEAAVAQHIVLFEPGGAEMAVRESYVWKNTGKTTFNDPQNGTLRFYAPPQSKGIQVSATAPQGAPIRVAPERAGQANVYKIDFPIKPGESNINLDYTVPFTSPGAFESKVFYKGAPTSFIVPQGVSLKGAGITFREEVPRFKVSTYQTTAAAYKVEIEGTGALQQSQAAESESGPQLQFVLPKLYDKLYWILGLAFSILLLGFVLLYRAGQTPVPAEPRASTGGPKKR